MISNNNILGYSISEKFVLSIVLLNTLVFISLDLKPELPTIIGSWIIWVDYFCVLFFIYEFFIKLRIFGPRAYFKDKWNIFDFIIVLGSLPILLEPFTGLLAISWLPIVRITRLFRLARFMRLSRLIRYTQRVENLKRVRLPFYLLLLLVALHLFINFFDVNTDISNFILSYYSTAAFIISTWLLSRSFSIILIVFIEPALRKNADGTSEAIEAIIAAIGQIAIWTIGLALAVEAAGYSSFSIFAGLGFGGMAIAFAAQDLIANILGGVMLYIQKPFEIGDNIQVSNNRGIVKKIGLRSLTIQTFTGRLVSIPNKTMISAQIENITSESYTEQNIQLNISFNNSPKMLEVIICEITNIAKNNRFIAEDYAIRFGEMSHFGHKLIFNFYFKNALLKVSDPEQELFELVNSESSKIYIEIVEKLHENEIQIYDQHNSHIASASVTSDI